MNDIQKKLEELNAAVQYWEDALQKLKSASQHPSPLAVATLNQDECHALIIGIRDTFHQLEGNNTV